jgi:hypothetical protein
VTSFFKHEVQAAACPRKAKETRPKLLKLSGGNPCSLTRRCQDTSSLSSCDHFLSCVHFQSRILSVLRPLFPRITSDSTDPRSSSIRAVLSAARRAYASLRCPRLLELEWEWCGLSGDVEMQGKTMRERVLRVKEPKPVCRESLSFSCCPVLQAVMSGALRGGLSPISAL